MKIENCKDYLWIKPENDNEIKELQSIESNGGELSIAVSFKGEVLALKLWKEKRQ